MNLLEPSSLFNISIVQAADLGEVQALAAHCIDGPHWPDAAWARYVQTTSTAGPCGVLLAARNTADEVLGWLAGSLLAGTAELDFILVDPECRGLGVARRLMAVWLEWLHLHEAEEAFLEVRASHTAALHLYGAFGFVQVGCRKGYYSNPPEDAHVLGKTLGKAARVSPPLVTL